MTEKMEKPVEMGSARFAANDMLFELARRHPNVVVMTCDNSQQGTPLHCFGEEFRERFIDTGIAEQNTVGMAAGLALSGKKVFCQSFACFLTTRAIEYMYLDAAYNNLPIVFMGTHCGVSASTAGPTHFAVMDIAYTRTMPNMTVIAPSDPRVAAKIMEESITWTTPIYLRLPKGLEPLVYRKDIDVHIGKGILARDGMDLTLVGCGTSVFQCLKAAEELERRHRIQARVIDLHTIKPIDVEILVKAAEETRVIVTCEDHVIAGGMGSAVLEAVTSAELRQNIFVRRLGIVDNFPPQGRTPEYIYQACGYDAEAIVAAAKEIHSKKIGKFNAT